MKLVYSPSKNLFYAEHWDYTDIPDDIVPVTESVFSEFSGIPPTGKIRITGENGMPAWVDAPPLTHEELILSADTRKQTLIDQANAYMNSKQWPGKAAIGRLTTDDLAQYNLWLDYLDALEAVDTSIAPDIDWPEMPA